MAAEISSGLWRVMPWPYFQLSREGKILFVSKHLTKMLSCTAGELLERNIEEVFVVDVESGNIKSILDDLKDDESWHGDLIYNGRNRFSFELIFQLDPKDENIVWGIVMENPVINGEMMVSTQNELKLLKMLLDHTIDYVYFIDTSGQFVITNKAFQRALKVPYSGFEIGRKLSDFVSEETDRQFAATDQRVFETNQLLINHISYFEREDGTGQWVQSTKIPVYNPRGECIGLVCVSRDITELSETTRKMRQAMRRAELASEAKSDFLANMSHEIRTPINGIIGMSELCMDTNLNNEQEEYISSVHSCTKSLLRIVNDILDFSKIEAGHLDIERIGFDLKKCIKEVHTQMSPTVKNDNVDFLLEVADDIPQFVRGDPTRLRQILFNLISNAIKFTHEGSVILKVKKTRYLFPGKNISFQVVDTGVGIAKDRQDNVFQSFTQADNSTTRKYGGTGLGLTIVSQLTELMGGSISLESKENVGTNLTVQLPMQVVTEDGATVEDSDTALSVEGPFNILVVEDNPVNRRIVVSRLNKMGHKVSVADNGEQALQMFTKADFDLILMDVQMPVMDGLTATREIRKIEDDKDDDSHIPIIAMTARALKDDKDQCREAGMDNYVAKPFHADMLKRAISEAMGGLLSAGKKGNYVGHRRVNTISFDKILRTLSAEDREDMIDAAKVYLDYYENEIKDLDESIEGSEFTSIFELAHRIKGGLGALQDWASFNEAEMLEEAANDKDDYRVATHYKSLKSRMYELADEIKEAVKN